MLKRIFDIAASFLSLIILSPVIAIVAWQVKKKLGSPVLFRQVRPGLNGKPFEMIKFRTMLDAYDKEGNPLPNEQRFTEFGNFLRSTSLDELPELWNVLKGDMSLVGPRPLLVEYLPLYNKEQARRHEVRPGVTGWAQVNGRNAISWEEKFKLDTWYVDNNSLWLDIKILFLTVKKVFIKEGVNAAENVTMQRFQGTQEKQLAILGASGHGKVVAEIAELNGWNKVVFFDDAWPELTENEKWSVEGNTEVLFDKLNDFDGVIVAIGNNRIRLEKTKELIEKKANLITLIHPSATVSSYSTIGLGSVVVAGAVVNPFSSIGLAAIINTCSSVGHDCVLEDAVHICPGARLAGASKVDNCSWVGVGASVKQQINIGQDVTVGAGACVVKDIESFCVVTGVPAKRLLKGISDEC